MARETLLILDGFMNSLFSFCREERFEDIYKESLRLFMDLHPHSDLAHIDWTAQDEKNFLMWFCFEVLHDDLTLCEYWLDEISYSFPKIRALASALNRSNIALYYLQKEKSGYRHLSLRDMLSQEEVNVWHPIIYQLRDKPLIYGLRVIKIEEGYFPAEDLYVFPREISEDIMDFIHRHLQGYYGKEIDTPKEFPSGAGYLLNHLRLTLKRSDEIQKRFNEMREKNKHEKIEKIISHFAVENQEMTIRKLEELHNLSFLGEESGHRFYEWYNNHLLTGKDEPDGGIILSKTKLTLHCADSVIEDAIRKKLNTLLKGLVRYMYNTVIKRKE